MFTVTGLRKRFQDNAVLDGINLSFEKGEVVALIGPSGTGKSTFLRCLNLLETPDEGVLTMPDARFDLAHCGKRETLELRKRTAMVFQQFNLFHKKTALQNVMEGPMVVKKIPREQAEARAREELAKVGLADKEGYYPKHLSGGQQQRVAIARALAMDPEILLLDEPTSALDPELVQEVLETIRKVASEGNTLLMASHEMRFVRHVATQVVFLSGGKVVEAGSTREVFEHPQHELTQRFLASWKKDA